MAGEGPGLPALFGHLGTAITLSTASAKARPLTSNSAVQPSGDSTTKRVLARTAPYIVLLAAELLGARTLAPPMHAISNESQTPLTRNRLVTSPPRHGV